MGLQLRVELEWDIDGDGAEGDLVLYCSTCGMTVWSRSIAMWSDGVEVPLADVQREAAEHERVMHRVA